MLIFLVNIVDKYSCMENIVLFVIIFFCRNGKYLIILIVFNFVFLLFIILYLKRFKLIYKWFVRFVSYIKILWIIFNRNVGLYKINIFDGLYGLFLWLMFDY